MLYPSVDALKSKIDSKYSLVSLAAKRARQLHENGEELLVTYRSKKPVGMALEEVAAGILTKVEQDKAAVYEDEV